MSMSMIGMHGRVLLPVTVPNLRGPAIENSQYLLLQKCVKGHNIKVLQILFWPAFWSQIDWLE